MRVELSGDLPDEIDDDTWRRWRKVLTIPQQRVYQKLHELINDGLESLDSKQLAAACGVSQTKLFREILPQLEALGLAYGSEE